MAAELDDRAVLDHGDPVGLPDGGEPVRDEDRGAGPGRGEHPLEDLRLAADIELGGRLVEQDQAGACRHGGHRAGQGDPLPLAAGQLGAAGVALGQDGVQVGQAAGPGFGERGRRDLVKFGGGFGRLRQAAARRGSTFSRSVSSKRTKSWKTAVTRRRHEARSRSRRSVPSTSMEPDCGSYKRHSSLARVVLPAPLTPDDRERRPGWDVQVEAAQHRPVRAGRVGEADVAEPDVLRGHAVGWPADGGAGARGAGAGRDSARCDSARCHSAGGERAGLAIAALSRPTAATGAAEPSSAQFSPPNAIIAVPTAAWA